MEPVYDPVLRLPGWFDETADIVGWFDDGFASSSPDCWVWRAGVEVPANMFVWRGGQEVPASMAGVA